MAKENQSNQNDKNKDSKSKNQNLPSAAETIAALQAEKTLLQQQLQQRSEDDLRKKQEEEEARLKLKAEKDREKLESDANLEALLNKSLAEEPTERQGKDVDDLTPSQILHAVGDAFGRATDAQAKLILQKVEEKLNESDQKITGTQKVLIDLMAGLGVKEARGQFKDFDAFKDDIRNIMQKTQGLSVEDAYLLAKSRKAKDQPPQEKIESEKPTRGLDRSAYASAMLSGRAPAAEESSGQGDSSRKEEGGCRGRAAFMAALDKAIDKTLSSE